jgi:hypothetical protein
MNNIWILLKRSMTGLLILLLLRAGLAYTAGSINGCRRLQHAHLLFWAGQSYRDPGGRSE